MSVLPDHIDSSISVLIDEFLADLEARQYSATTVDAYRDPIKQLFCFVVKRGIERVQDVTAEHLEAYGRRLMDRDFKSSSTYAYLQRIRSFFAFLEKRQYLLVNPFEEFRMPHPERSLQPVPTESDMTQLLEEPDTNTATGVRDRALLEVAYSTGARLAELTAMNANGPDFVQKTIKVTGKGKKDRMLPLGSAALKWLKEYLSSARSELLTQTHADERALWIGKNGRRFSKQLIGRRVRDYGKQAGISVRITPHSIRRACATHLLAHGAHPMQVQALLGHSSVTTLKHYLKVTISDMKNAHEQSNPGR